jgi:hypothetical protein
LNVFAARDVVELGVEPLCARSGRQGSHDRAESREDGETEDASHETLLPLSGTDAAGADLACEYAGRP